MRLPDIFPKLITEDYQTEKKDMILAAIDACESMEDMSKLISYGSFKATGKPCPWPDEI
jgi:hypothetical protein